MLRQNTEALVYLKRYSELLTPMSSYLVTSMRNYVSGDCNQGLLFGDFDDKLFASSVFK